MYNKPFLTIEDLPVGTMLELDRDYIDATFVIITEIEDDKWPVILTLYDVKQMVYFQENLGWLNNRIFEGTYNVVHKGTE